METIYPDRAAKFTATRANATHFAGFLPYTYLAHFYPNLETIGKNFYEFTEIDSIIGCIIKYGFTPITLIFYIIYLHREIQILDYASCL